MTRAKTRNDVRAYVTQAQLNIGFMLKLGSESQASESGVWLPKRELQECGLALNTGYIIGGSTIVRGEFPFLVLLGYRNDDPKLPVRYRCGGALINRKYVLTAAHCHNLDNVYDQIIEVVVGEHDVAVDPDCLNGCAKAQRFKPQEIILHPEYTISSRYSIYSLK